VTDLLGEVGRAVWKDGLAAFFVVVLGILNAPNTDAAVATGIAGSLFIASTVLKAVQVYAPKVTLEKLAPNFKYGYVFDGALRAFLSGLITLGLGVLAAPSLDDAKLLATSGLIALATAVITALQGTLTRGTSPAPATGLPG
jgi:hypothetical protein